MQRWNRKVHKQVEWRNPCAEMESDIPYADARWDSLYPDVEWDYDYRDYDYREDCYSSFGDEDAGVLDDWQVLNVQRPLLFQERIVPPPGVATWYISMSDI